MTNGRGHLSRYIPCQISRGGVSGTLPILHYYQKNRETGVDFLEL